MFFKKAPSKNKTAENLPDTIIEPKTEKQGLVYIIGDNALACYLGAKLSVSKRIIIISGTSENNNLNTNGINLKEEPNLQKKHYRFQTSFRINEKPEAILITSSLHKIKAAIASTATKNTGDTPVICFTPLKKLDIFSGLFGKNIFRAFFDGYLTLNNQHLSQLGKQPSVTLCIEEQNPCFPLIKNLFSSAEINTQFETDATTAFWNYFVAQTAGSFLSAYFNKNMSLITKDKSLRDSIKPLVKELCTIARTETALIDEEEILKKLYNTPNNYVFPLQAEFSLGKSGGLDMITSYFLEISHDKKLPETEIRKILNKLYNIILA